MDTGRDILNRQPGQEKQSKVSKPSKVSNSLNSSNSLRRLWKIVICILLCISAVSLSSVDHLAYADAGVISVYIGEEKLEFEVDPIIVGGRIMVPLRTIFEALGADVRWIESTRSVIATRKFTRVWLRIGSRTMQVNDRKIVLDAAPLLHKGKTLIPVRAVAESFGYEVGWDSVTRSVRIINQDAELMKMKHLVMSLDPNRYLDLKIEGDRLKIRGKFTYDDFDEIWINLYHGDSHDDVVMYSDYLNPKIAEEQASDDWWYLANGQIPLNSDSAFEYELTLRNSNANAIYLWGCTNEDKFPADDDSERDFVSIYNDLIYIDKKDGEFVFVPTRVYQENLKVMKRLLEPQRYLGTAHLTDAEKVALKKVSDEITAGAKTDREKLLRIHDWMVGQISYNKDFSNKKTTLNYDYSMDVIRHRLTQCYGYSILFTDLARLQGIPTTKAIGYIKYDVYTPDFPRNDEGANFNLHSWNVAYVDDRWIQIDVTWDSNNEYVDGVHWKKKGHHTYFDIDLKAISYNHLLDYFRETHDWDADDFLPELSPFSDSSGE